MHILLTNEEQCGIVMLKQIFLSQGGTLIMENVEICHCMGVTYADIENALHSAKVFSDVEREFEEVQKITHCSTGCGGCHDKILDTISEIMSK